MAAALCGLDIPRDPNLLVGLERSDDAGVYRLTDEIALVQTVDFFTPIVDDPYLFGQIAAANSLSDVYAMGGRPLCAMNIVAFPSEKLGIHVLKEILRGGLDKLKEAGVALVGGHSVTDQELKYGLSVTGLVHPARVLTNRGAKPGDALVLTKRLGTGIINTALKADMAAAEAVSEVACSMATLNRAAAQALDGLEVHACTDVTGFGLLGHLNEMIDGTETSARIRARALPAFEAARGYAEMGLLPAGLHRNLEHWRASLVVGEGVDRFHLDLIADPQTSGGLLAALPAHAAGDLVARLAAAGVEAWTVAEITSDAAGVVYLDG